MFRNATVRAIHFPSLVWAEQKSWNRLEESFSALCAMIEVQSYLLGANIFNPFCAYLHIDKCWPTIITTHGIHNPFIITIENDHFAIVFVEFHKNEMDKDVRIWRNVLLLSVRSRNRPSPLVKVQIFADIYDSDASFYLFHDLFDRSSDFSELSSSWTSNRKFCENKSPLFPMLRQSVVNDWTVSRPEVNSYDWYSDLNSS